MIRRPCDEDPCRDCWYSEWWDCGEDEDGNEYVEYRCRADMGEDCDGEPGRLSDYELYRRENPRE